MPTVTIKDSETGEIKKLQVYEYDNHGAILEFFKDEAENFLTEHLEPFRPIPLHSISKGGGYLLNEKMVLVIDVVKD